MTTILALAAAALGAVMAFRRTPEGAAAVADDSTLTKVRRSTSVVLALAEALWTILDALTFITGRRVQPVTGVSRAPTTARSSPAFGSQPASDVTGD